MLLVGTSLRCRGGRRFCLFASDEVALELAFMLALHVLDVHQK